MKAIFRSGLLACCLLFITGALHAQCTNAPDGQFPTTTVALNPSSNAATQLTSCAYTGEYSVVSNVQTGKSYTVTSSTATNYITVTLTDGTTVVAHGPQPFTFTATSSANLHIYRHDNAACGTTASGCRTINMNCNDCAVVLPPPANDNCSGAVSLTHSTTCSPTSGNVSGATQSQAGCTGTADDDVWYSFVATATSANVTVVGSASFDAVVQAFSGSCGSLVQIGTCRDNTLSGGTETLSLTGLTIGSTYYVRTYDYYSTTPSTTTFTICVTAPSPPPANDNCAGAISLTHSPTCTPTTGNVSGATQSQTGCTGTANDDVWYSFVATATSADVIVTGSASFDAVVQAFSGSCGSLVQVGTCRDNTLSGATETLSLTGLTIGNTYYVRTYDYFSGFPATTTFTICVVAPIPPCNAPGTPSASNIGTTSATLSWPAAAGALTYDWTSGTGASCPTGTGANTAATSVNLTGLTPNTTYRFCVRTSTCGGGASSSYVTTTFTTAPLPNDNCAGAITVTCSSTTNGSTVGASSDAAVGSCGIGSGGTPGNGVWYKFVGNGAQATISLCGSAYDTKLHVYSGTCGTLTCVTSNDNNAAACPSATTRSQVVFNAAVGTDYYILISGAGSSTGAFSMSITCLCGPALGAPWTVTNIGASNGGAIENVCDGTTDVRATNYGSPTNDVMTYAWQQMCGNGFIKAKLENVTNGGWGGIMFRENNAGGSKKIALRSQLTNNVVRDLRAATNGVAQQQQFPRPNTPQWLRLTRTGNIFLGETSVDGVNWDYTFSVTLVLPSCIEVGLFAQSINVNTTATAIFSNIMGVSTTPPPIPLVDGSNGIVETQETLSLFPNPASDEINVKMEAFYGKNVTISVQNQLGQVLIQRDIDDVQDATERIELNNMPAGIYNLTVRTAGQAPVSKQFMVGNIRP